MIVTAIELMFNVIGNFLLAHRKKIEKLVTYLLRVQKSFPIFMLWN